MNSTIKLLEQTGSFLPEPKPNQKGRRANKFAQTKDYRLVMQTYVLAQNLGGRRGDFMRAVNLIAKRHNIKPETLRKVAQRHRYLKSFALSAENIKDLCGEIDRRMFGFPDPIRDFLLEKCSMTRLLVFLRSNNINGDCPQKLVSFYYENK
jgi:hypothetical protein